MAQNKFQKCADEIDRYFKNRGYTPNPTSRISKIIGTKFSVSGVSKRSVYFYPSQFNEVTHPNKHYFDDIREIENFDKYFLEHIQPIIDKYEIPYSEENEKIGSFMFSRNG